MCRVKPHGEQVVAPGGRSMSVLIKNSLEIKKKKKEFTVNKAVNWEQCAAKVAGIRRGR